ncbi:AAA family ATPase [Paraburkholderia sediminicola]|uniref:AAA family ATPase n=1 Tax=Paraburkholderia sediminicola TaxID=458836 RepID=UPI0038BDCCA6
MLIAFGGLPGTGKTTVARRLARQLAAVYLRIDSIEQALIKSDMSATVIGPSGYMVAYAVATDNLRLGMTVVADSVNSLSITRNAWKSVALEAGVQCFEIELVCSNSEEHRSRVESRIADIPGHALPSWRSLLQRDCDPWNSPHLVVDTAMVSADRAVEMILQNLAKTPPESGSVSSSGANT